LREWATFVTGYRPIRMGRSTPPSPFGLVHGRRFFKRAYWISPAWRAASLASLQASGSLSATGGGNSGTESPRRPIGAGGARGASRSGSVPVTTHALFTGKVQRKVRNGVADLARRWIISGSASCYVRQSSLGYAEIAPIRVRALAMQLHDDVRVRTRFILASGNERYLLWTFRSSNPITQAS